MKKLFLFTLLAMNLTVHAQWNTILLGSSSNAYSGIGDRPLQYSPYSGTIAFIHRQNINNFAGFNGELRIDVSKNGGLSFQNDAHLVSPGINTRRPSLVFTGNATQPCQQTAYWTSHLFSPYLGQMSGFADTVSCTANLQNAGINLPDTVYTSIAASQNNVWVANNSANSDSIFLYKVNYPALNLVLSDSIFDIAKDCKPKIAFSEDGLTGHLIYMGVSAHSFPYYYRLWHWKTTDAGLTWQSDQKILNTFGQGNLKPMAYDLSVDYQGNAHVILNAAEQHAPTYHDSLGYYESGTKRIFVLKHDGLNWSSFFVTQLHHNYLEISGGQIYEYENSVQIARTMIGDKMYAIWTDDSSSFSNSTTHSDLWMCSWDALQPATAINTIHNETPAPSTWHNKIFFPKLAPIVQLTNCSNNQLHMAFAELGATADEPIQWRYIQNFCSPIPTASGLVFLDNNTNGIYDAGIDLLLNGFLIHNSNGWTTTSNQNGEYTVFLDSGNVNNLSLTSSSQILYTQSTPLSYSITPSSSGSQGTQYNFAVQYIPNIQDLRVDISGVVAAPGRMQSPHVMVRNIGSVNMTNVQLKVLIPAGFSFNYASPPISQQIGNTLIWNNISLNVAEMQNFQISWTTSSFAVVGTPYQIQAWVEPSNNDSTPANNYDLFQDIIRASWDPNDKTVNITQLDPLTLNQELNYTIRFQNIGTDTAFTVVIRDTLSNNLDMSTFRIVGASHHYSYIVRDHSLLEVFFQNILLPDSFTNEPKSHGFVQYAIKPKSTLQVGDKIENTAYIYFDFNLPVVTNTTTTNIQTTSVSGFSTIEANIYPNPSNGKIRISLAQNEQSTLSISDLTGKILLESSVKNGSEIDLKDLSAGVYVAKISNSSGMKVVKLVRE